MNITILNANQHSELIELIRAANKPVADMLGLTTDNASGHTAFYSSRNLQSDLSKGNVFYVAHLNNEICGCIALRKADAKVWYINRLATLPNQQGKGVATQLLDYCIKEVAREHGSLIRAGVITEHESLTDWYLKRGFVAGKTKSFARLPFKISYLSYYLADK